jgi:hypothetical protein
MKLSAWTTTCSGWFFGAAGDTLWNLERLKSATKRFVHADLDIRDRTGR